MKIVFLLVIATVLVGLASTAPNEQRKENVFKALLNKVAERKLAKAQNYVVAQSENQLANEALLKLMQMLNQKASAQFCVCVTSPCPCDNSPFKWGMSNNKY